MLRTQRKTIFSENMMKENPEKTPFATQAFPNLIREDGRTVDSGRVATIIENYNLFSKFKASGEISGSLFTCKATLEN